MRNITPLLKMPFHVPSDYYCEDLAPLDEQICALLAKRKENSKNNSGFPGLERISEWSKKYNLDERWLQRIFASFMQSEIQVKPPVEPTGFLKYVSILKATQQEDISYAVTYMKQYSNASVVYVEIEINTPEPYVRLGHASFGLLISPEYHCRTSGGSGSGKGWQHSFIVVPPLPDDVAELEFRLSIKPFPEDREFREVVLKETTIAIK
ncbi:hypothetical protein REC12_24235 [Desulfosporosinus sp. PR]|uniref:hypothetical protein n=1 Tax=Candidatus Desulfosporosinus nitrosoreducens TaxID=3401928 RepID=UPI0027FE372E|nr:hypothetical protein [Desulfosporosinus sp. PR]MDQ7096706.1 hypothetical protein [Desulfosporosinus sp. PR]